LLHRKRATAQSVPWLFSAMRASSALQASYIILFLFALAIFACYIFYDLQTVGLPWTMAFAALETGAGEAG
jgi:hypothetical protein